jgi:hypothetical protein
MTAGRSEQPRLPGIDPRMHDALTDLHTYALVLDAEWRRMGEQAAGLRSINSADVTEIEVRRAQVAEELEVLRATIAALRAKADPLGRLL